MAMLHNTLLARLEAVSFALKEPTLEDKVEAFIDAILSIYETKNKLFAIGNGGNAANAEQLVTELIARYCYDRDPIGALLLTAAGPFTAINNDYGYSQGFARQVKGLAKTGDIVVGYSSSGMSENVLEAVHAAKAIGATTVGFSGSKGDLRNLVDISITVQSTFTPVIEEAHLMITHIICGEVEEKLFSESGVRMRTPDY